MITLALFARWGRFSSERDFYRYAQARLRGAFPTLPERSQFNRLVRSHVDLLEAFVSHLWRSFWAHDESLFTKHSGQLRDAPFRDAKRRGVTDGSPGVPTSVGVIAWDGRRALGCSPPSTQPGSSRGFWLLWRFHRRPASSRNLLRRQRAQPNPRLGSVGSASTGYPTWSTRASRGQITTDGGSGATERSLFARPNACQ